MGENTNNGRYVKIYDEHAIPAGFFSYNDLLLLAVSPNNIKVYDQNGSLLGLDAIANKITIYAKIWEGYKAGHKPIFGSAKEAEEHRYTIHADEDIFDFYLNGEFISGCRAPRSVDDCFVCSNDEGCSIDPESVDFSIPLSEGGQWILGNTPAYKVVVDDVILGYVAFNVIEG